MDKITSKELFGKLDLSTIDQDENFKEDSVREVIITPLLQQLGYTQDNIVRSKTLEHPFIKIGSKKRPIKLIPDYAIRIENNYAWVLDAKAPTESVTDPEHIEQVYSYATHPEIRSIYFAICNGKDFVLFRREHTDKPVLSFSLSEIEHYWDNLKLLISPDSFQVGKNFTYDTTNATAKPSDKFDYNNRVLLEEIPVKKRAAKRHFGVHGYFTKQSWNVVADYIKNFSKPGDLVLDPFCGSGVTPIEALMNNRSSISLDINPLAIFVTQALIAPIKHDKLAESFNKVMSEYNKFELKTTSQINKILEICPYPKGIKLPKDSDVDTIEKLFSPKQLAQLSLLKSIILKEKEKNIRNSLLLMFSGLLTKVNLTYHTSKIATKDGQGDAAAFRYYRYRMAPKPKEIDIEKYFTLRYKKIVAAKKDIRLPEFNH